PVVGVVRVEGMLLQEAEDAVLRAVRETYPSVQRVVLSLLAEGSRRSIYVHGEVLNPGKYEFTENPSVWEALREAGGATPQAALQTVRIIRAEGEGRRTLLVDLQSVIENGNFESLPTLRPGDTVIIPERSIVYSGGGAVRVIGGVVTPGPYNLTGDRSLIDAILAAGGPTEGANLKKVNIIRRMADGGQITITVDFAKYLDDGDVRHNPVIYPDDAVHVPVKTSAGAWTLDPRFWLAAVTAFAAVYAVLQ
ncbi:MAG: SLBB domain-containing protein, partial [Candidatus Krumholzibacteria bacterium]|nr:SLBB domain-containing protein [Candidatus Krumholzibacteria bacterium]